MVYICQKICRTKYEIIHTCFAKDMEENRYSLYDCNQCIFKRLSQHYLGNSDFETIRKNSVQMHFKKGEYIFKQGGKSSHLIFMHRGVVKFCIQNESSKNFIMTVVSGPKLLGGANLFFKETNIFSIVAVEDSEICLIDATSFTEAIMKHSSYMMVLFERALEMFQASIFNFISLAHKQVNGRIADILLYLNDNVYANSTYDFTLSRKEIAEFAACSHENVINTLSRFNKEGIIRLEGKKITIVDREKLEIISKNG